MPPSYGRSIAIAVFACVLTFSPYAHAADSVTVPIGDPFSDAIQLWSGVLSSIESLEDDLTAALPSGHVATTQRPSKHTPKQLPSAAVASVAVAVASLPASTTSSGGTSTISIATQPPKSRSPPPATAHVSLYRFHS